MDILSPGAIGVSILSVTENGFGKRSPVDDYRLQSRGGKGVITIKTTARNGKLVGTQQITEQDDVMLITDRGKIIRLRGGEIRLISRNTQGVKLIERGGRGTGNGRRPAGRTGRGTGSARRRKRPRRNRRSEEES